MNKVLVISPHPDDEALGCGGTIRQHILDGDSVEVVFLTSGEQGIKGKPKEETAKIREQEAACAAQILGISKIEFWREHDGALRVTKNLVERLQQALERLRPQVIYVPHNQEFHEDHVGASMLVAEAVKGMDSSFIRPRVWMYEVWTPVQTLDRIADISGCIEAKRRAIQAYQSQCAIMKLDEAILGLNRYRGEMHSWPGGDYAEVFKKMPV